MGGADFCNWSAPDPRLQIMLRICGRCARHLVRGRSKLPRDPHLFRVHSTTTTLNVQVSTLPPALDRRENVYFGLIMYWLITLHIHVHVRACSTRVYSYASHVHLQCTYVYITTLLRCTVCAACHRLGNLYMWYWPLQRVCH